MEGFEMKRTFEVNNQTFTTCNGALAAIKAYNRKNPSNKFDRSKGHKIYIKD